MNWLAETFIGCALEARIQSYHANVASSILFVQSQDVSINDQIYHQFSLEEEGEENISANDHSDNSDASPLINVKDHTQTSIATESQVEDLSVDEQSTTGSEISGISVLATTIEIPDADKKFPAPEIDKKERLLCTYIESSSRLSFQLLKYEPALNVITELLVEDPSVEPFEELRKDLHVVAKSEGDDIWYRAIILNMTDEADTMVNVLYIDFGNTELIPAANIRPIFDERLMQPITCVNCKLHNVKNLDEEQANEWLEEKCLDQEFAGEFVESKSDVKQVIARFLESSDKTPINQQLQSLFPMKIDSAVLNRTDIDKMTPNTVKKIQYVKGTEAKTITDSHGFSWMTLEKGTCEKAVCCAVESVDVLYFHLLRFNDKLEKMMNSIAMAAEDLPSVRVLEKGAPCIAQADDLSWYRGRVQSIATMANIEFVDYGRHDDVIPEDIHVLEEKMLVDPVYCIRCNLSGVNITSEENRADVMEYLTKTLTVDGAPDVYLKIDSFCSESISHGVTLLQDSQNINEFLQNNFGPCGSLRNRVLRPGDQIRVSIPSTKSLSSFHCIFYDTKSEMEAMVRSLTDIYNAEDVSRVVDLDVGTFVCVQSKTTGVWSRGMVSKVDGDAVAVSLVDSGAEETFNASHVHSLLSEFCRLEIQSFKATLFDLRPSKNAESWSEDAVAGFNNICKDDVLTATIINTSDGLNSVALVTSNGDAMYELLTNQNFAERGNDNLTNGTISNGH